MTPLLPKLKPRADVVFRRLFNEENGCRLLISLLNAILRYPKGRRIRRLTLLRSHLAGPLAADKEVVLGLRAETVDGRIFHIEVQVCLKPCYNERILFYWAGMSPGEGGQESEKWLYWLQHGDEMTQEDVQRLNMPEIMEAERKLEMISQDRELRVEYERRIMAHHDAVTMSQWAQNSRKEGLNEGKRALGKAILGMCELLGLTISEEQKADLDDMELPELEELCQHLKQFRTWPTP